MSEDQRLTVLTAAYLVGEGMTQEKIARQLGISQSGVSRLLRRAKPYLAQQTLYRFQRELVDPKLLDAVLQRASLQRLSARLDAFAKTHGWPRGPAVRVLPVPESPDGDLTRRFTAFTNQAAPYVRSLLMRDSVETCGITWGFMLWDLCMGMRNMRLPAPWRPRRPIRFIPLSGDPLQDRRLYPPSLTSSNIAAELSKIANEDEYRPPWLGLVPAYIPNQFKGEALRAIERLIRLVPEFEEIFGSKGRPGIAHELDAILTSVGPASKPLGFGLGRLLGSLGSGVQRLSEQIHGDIGGVLLPRAQNRPSALIRGIERRWKGLNWEHLQACAHRALQEDPATGRSGVVVLAVGADRAEVVLRAVERGLVNNLIIDPMLEQALTRLLTGGPGRTAERCDDQ
jgi:hypothetical protein